MPTSSIDWSTNLLGAALFVFCKEGEFLQLRGCFFDIKNLHFFRISEFDFKVLCVTFKLPSMMKNWLPRKFKIHPNLKCLFMSGYTANVIAPIAY